jgi:hypothetical protein
MNFVLGDRQYEKATDSWLKGITNWCIKELMPRMRTLDIEVKLRDTLNTEGAYGWCMQNDNTRVCHRHSQERRRVCQRQRGYDKNHHA